MVSQLRSLRANVTTILIALAISFLVVRFVFLGKDLPYRPVISLETTGIKVGNVGQGPFEFLLALTVTGTRYDKEFKRTVLQILRFCIPDIDTATIAYDDELGKLVARSYAYGGQGSARACHLNVLASEEATVEVLGMFRSFVDYGLLVPMGEHMAREGLTCSQHISNSPVGGSHASTITSCYFKSGFKVSVYPINPLLEHHTMNWIANVTGCQDARCSAWLSRLLLAEYLPQSVTKVILLDLDTLILGDLEILFDHFSYMPKEAVIGIAYELQPTLMDNAWTAPSRSRFNLGYGPHIGFPGFNGGVALYDLAKMRESKTYRQLVSDPAYLLRIREEFTDTKAPMYWGDQDLLSLIYLQHPALFYILPCGWNYQLCAAGFGRAFVANRPFDFWCHDEPKIYHANCWSRFPHGNNGILVQIEDGKKLSFQDAPTRKGVPRSFHQAHKLSGENALYRDAKVLPMKLPTSGLSHSEKRYYTEAAANLTAWNNGLLVRMFAQYRMSTQCGAEGCSKHPEEPSGNDRFQLFEPVVACPPGTKLKRWGKDGDGGKWLCGVEKLQSPCTVLSLGSNGQYDFEEAMLEYTPCEVHTFDCTYNGKSLQPRHHYHKLCLGDKEKAESDANFVTLHEATSQLVGVDEVDILKMDIEGFEYDIMSRWEQSDALPRQVSFELHYGDVIYMGTQHDPKAKTAMWKGRDVNLAEMTLFMSHLAQLGYAIVNKEDNSGCLIFTSPVGGSELTLIRVGNRI